MMDYTSLALVKQEIVSGGAPAISSQYDALITRLVTAASADIDEYCSQVRQPQCLNYFKLETITDEICKGISYDPDSAFLFWPHKPLVTAVTSIEVRPNPTYPWETVGLDVFEIDGAVVKAWQLAPADRFQVRVSYSGGLGVDLASLPASLIEAATVLAARYFKEASTGLPDTIGLADIGVLTYSKTMPIRVKASLDRLRRWVPW